MIASPTVFSADNCLSSENAFIAFAESFSDPIIVISRQGIIAFCNRAFLTLLGYSAAELLGKPLDTLFAEFQFDTCYAPKKKIPAEDAERYTVIMDADIVHKNRNLLTAEVTMCPLHIEHSSRYMLVCRFTAQPDIPAGFTSPAETGSVRSEPIPEKPNDTLLIGDSPAMRRVRDMVTMVAKADSGILITGDSGTGKELVAESLHRSSPRADRPMVKLNCSALPETLLESELFGHVKGSFTGAIKDTPGRFQAADGGSLFLDEIGDISPALQVKLLRVLQDQEFNRIGESAPVKVDVRIIAATNQDLSLLIGQKLFREDLYYRLKVFEIAVPPLRERTQDIPLLVEYFLKELNQKFKKNKTVVTDAVMNLFLAYTWPGNVRELAHALEHALILCTNGKICLHHLPCELQKSRLETETAPVMPCQHQADRLREALCKTGGNKARAARLLGIDRKTLYRHMKKYNISFHA